MLGEIVLDESAFKHKSTCVLPKKGGRGLRPVQSIPICCMCIEITTKI